MAHASKPTARKAQGAMAMRRPLAAVLRGSSTLLLPSSSPFAGGFRAAAVESSAPSRLPRLTSMAVRYYRRYPARPGAGRNLHKQYKDFKKSYDFLEAKSSKGLHRLEWYEKVSWLFWSLYGSALIGLLLALHKESLTLQKLQADVDECKSKRTTNGVPPPTPDAASPSSTTKSSPRATFQAGEVRKEQ